MNLKDLGISSRITKAFLYHSETRAAFYKAHHNVRSNNFKGINFEAPFFYNIASCSIHNYRKWSAPVLSKSEIAELKKNEERIRAQVKKDRLAELECKMNQGLL